MERDESPAWGWTLALGIITIVLAMAMLMMPALSVGLISYWAGFLFVMLGVQLWILVHRLSVMKSQLNHHA